MAALSLLPIWAVHVRALGHRRPPEVVRARSASAPRSTATCSSCHGGSGEGGVGRPFTAGEVLQTFPHIEDQLRFVYFGTAEYNLAGVDAYGNPDREGGPHTTGRSA